MLEVKSGADEAVVEPSLRGSTIAKPGERHLPSSILHKASKDRGNVSGVGMGYVTIF